MLAELFIFVLINIPRLTGACPMHCKAGQTCDAEDFGCTECDLAYYGRQCQHRIECRFTPIGFDYRGLRNMTENGRTCQRWDSQSPHRHPFHDVEENYCRNPNNLRRMPFCLTVDPDYLWEFCEVTMCNTQCLSPPLNSSGVDVVNPPLDGFAVGFDAIIGCMTGYEGTAKVTLTCQSNRTWTQTLLPTCKRVQCSPPLLAENSYVSNPKSSYKYEEQASIACNSGYTLHGQSPLTCQADKTWSASVPTCKKLRCSLPSVPNGRVSIPLSKYEYQDIIRIVCDPGYTLQGQSKLTCQADESWSHSFPTCIKSAKIRGSSDVAVQGQTFTFLCLLPATPLIGVTVRRKMTTENIQNDYFTFSMTGGNCIGTESSVRNSESCTTSDLCTCSDDRKLFIVYEPSVPRTWHNSEWTCGETKSLASSPVLKLYVSVPFTTAEISPAEDLVTNISSSVHAVCTSSPASRPQADISWTLRKTDGTVIDITGSSTQVTDPDDNNPDLVKTTRSTLTYTPTDRSYNGASVYCQATNNRTTPQTSQERRLVVQYAPEGSIKLINNMTGQLTEGMSVSLTCEMSGGNPLASLSWSCKGQPLASVNRSADNVARWELEITVDRSYDGRNCVCTGTHPLWTDISNIALSVMYPPSGTPGLTITPKKSYYLMNDSVTLTCKSSTTSKPAVTFTWSCKDQDMTSSATNGNVGNIADSNLVIKVNSGYNGQSCICTVSHPVNNYRQSVNIAFNVHFTSKEPLILSSNLSEMYEGDDVQIMCSMKGGNPLSVLTLSCGDIIGADNSTKSTSSRFIDLKNIDKDRNNQTCVCKATHGDDALFRSKKELTLVVYYPPTKPRITTQKNTFPWLEGQEGHLLCYATDGNPADTQYTWTGNRIALGYNTSKSVTIGRLSYTDDKAEYICQVSNKFTEDKGVNVSSSILLDVQYKPRLNLQQNTTTVRETEHCTQTCSATGNPSPIVQWFFDGSAQGQRSQLFAPLSFVKTQRHNAGLYLCSATSTSEKYGRLETNATFDLIINYAPDVNITSRGIPYEGSCTFSLFCNVHGFPSTYTFHKWQHHYKGVFIREMNAGSFLKFSHPLSLNDSGTYTCVVDNGVKNEQNILLQKGSSDINIMEKTKYMDEGPSTTSIALVAVSSVLFLLTVVASVINILYFMKRRRQKLNDNGIRGDIHEMKHRNRPDISNVYKEHGKGATPREIHLGPIMSLHAENDQRTYEYSKKFVSCEPQDQAEYVKVKKKKREYVNVVMDKDR